MAHMYIGFRVSSFGFQRVLDRVSGFGTPPCSGEADTSATPTRITRILYKGRARCQNLVLARYTKFMRGRMYYCGGQKRPKS